MDGGASLELAGLFPYRAMDVTEKAL